LEACSLKFEQEMNAVAVILLESEQFVALLAKPQFHFNASVASQGKGLAKKLETRLQHKRKDILLGNHLEQQAEITAKINRMNSFHRQVTAIVSLAVALMNPRHDESSLHNMRAAVGEWGSRATSHCTGEFGPVVGSVLIDVGVGVDVGRFVSPKAAPVGDKHFNTCFQTSEIALRKILCGESRVES
jgi:hypothetical protein